MATPRTARVIDARWPCDGAGARVLALEATEPLGFVGGQYIIVDSGLTLPGGKAAKRAYSIASSDADQRRFEIAVQRIAGGPVSGYLHGVPVGATLSFSGPWGKMFPVEGASGAALVIATDTGISAALGLVQAARFRALAADALVVWLQVDGDAFLPHALVPARCELRCAALPPVGHPERVPHARGVLAEILARRPIAHGFCAGDGAVNYALLDDLVAAGIPATRDSVESFFNMPRKAAAAVPAT
jgi:ferredoxin-NADP reductase